MSLQTLKQKINAKGTGQAGSKCALSCNEGFTLNSGPRSLKYIGKASKMSTIRTIFKGDIAVNQGGTSTNAAITNVGDAKIEIVGKQPAIQNSVKNTKGSVNNRYKWVHSGVYPNIWVQETAPQSYDTYITKIHNKSAKGCDISSITDPCTVCPEVFKGVAINRRRVDQLKRENSQIQKNTDVPLSYQNYLPKMQENCTDPKGNQKPFPFPTSNPGYNALIPSCGGGNGGVSIYNAAPGWYTGIPTPDAGNGNGGNGIGGGSGSGSGSGGGAQAGLGQIFEGEVDYDNDDVIYKKVTNYEYGIPTDLTNVTFSNDPFFYIIIQGGNFGLNPTNLENNNTMRIHVGATATQYSLYPKAYAAVPFLTSTRSNALKFLFDHETVKPFTLITTTINGITFFVRKLDNTFRLIELTTDNIKFITEPVLSSLDIQQQLGNITQKTLAFQPLFSAQLYQSGGIQIKFLADFTIG